MIVLTQIKSLSLTHPRTVALAVQGEVPLRQVLGQVEPLGGEVKGLVLVESLLGGNLLLLQAQAEEFYGKETYLKKYGRRGVHGCQTDLQASPWKEEFHCTRAGDAEASY